MQQEMMLRSRNEAADMQLHFCDQLYSRAYMQVPS